MKVAVAPLFGSMQRTIANRRNNFPPIIGKIGKRAVLTPFSHGKRAEST